MSFKRLHPSVGSGQIYTQKQDRSRTIQIQKSFELYYKTAKEQNKLKEYRKLKYQGVIYKIGDFIQIYHFGSNAPYVAKLINIVSLIDDQSSEDVTRGPTNCPLIEIEWCLKKNDISQDKKYEKWEKMLSSNQLFASKQYFILPIQSIMGKCQVLTLEEYMTLEFIQNSIYFSRASYDMQNKKFIPDPSEWGTKYCICNNPYNPDMEYVQCQKCQKWYHNDCVIKEVKDLNNFVCGNCKRKGNGLFKKRQKGQN